jgi:hypothetical protein
MDRDNGTTPFLRNASEPSNIERWRRDRELRATETLVRDAEGAVKLAEEHVVEIAKRGGRNDVALRLAVLELKRVEKVLTARKTSLTKLRNPSQQRAR